MKGGGRRHLRVLGNALIGLGLLLLLGVGVAYGYSFYMEQQARSDPWLSEVQAAWKEASPTAEPAAVSTAEPTPEPTIEPTTEPATPTWTATAVPAATATARVTPVPTPTPTATATPKPRPTATPTPEPGPRTYPTGLGLRIPALGIDSRVVEVGIVDGEFEVPRFYVGWYRHTAKPGEPGNGIYTGHVESLDKGQVFANLPYAKPGQDVLLYTTEGVWRYRISEISKVPNNDVSVMGPTDDNRITLVTCTGVYDWSVRQYTHRLIVTAMLVNTDGPERP